MCVRPEERVGDRAREHGGEHREQDRHTDRDGHDGRHDAPSQLRVVVRLGAADQGDASRSETERRQATEEHRKVAELSHDSDTGGA